MGIEKTRRTAREVMYWPNMNNAISNMIMSCTPCQRHQRSQQKEPIIQHDQTKPWEKIGMDLFQLGNKIYLLAIDYYSKYPEIALFTNTTSDTIITHVKSMFARHGIPEQVISDNIPPIQLGMFPFVCKRIWFWSHNIKPKISPV